MKSYHSDKNLKKIFVQEIKKHEKADQIVQGHYGRENGKWKGCAVGCSVRSLNIRLKKDYDTSDHSVYEKELGIPLAIARLEDRIFEGLSIDEAKKFPRRFAEAVPVGADLSIVAPKLMLWLLDDKEHGVKKFATPKGVKAIKGVADLLLKKIKGKAVTIAEWQEARKSADAADAYADAADAYAAADAADAYAAAYAYRTARSKHWSKIANKLIELLKEAK